MATDKNLFSVLKDISLRRAEAHDLDNLSRRAGLSKYHFHRGFRRFVGETPRQYVQRLRLERAAILLGSSTASVLTIALDAGFGSHEVFTRTFRRNFGCSPSQYRSKIKAKGVMDCPAVQQARIQSIGPCVRFYHTAGKLTQGVIGMPTINVERRISPKQHVIFIRRRVPRNQLQELFSECFPKLFGHCIKAGHAVAGQPVARFVSTGDGLWTVDCAIPVAESAPGIGEMQAGFLRAGPVAFAIHVGEYDKLPETNAAIEQWIEENGYRRDGAAWESYVTDPAEHPNVADWRTEVFWPLAE